MKYVAIVPDGLEDVAIKEIKGEKVLPGRVVCNKIDIKKVQSVIKVYELWGRGKVDDIKIGKVKFEGSVRVSCHRKGEHDFNSQDVERIVGKQLVEQGYNVDYKSPDNIIFVDVLDDDYMLGLDLTPKLLSKRDYRIKIHNRSINACVAYSLVRLSGWKGEGIFLDPFCKDGVVCIEAANFKQGKIVGYDSLFHNVRSAEINSKLAEQKIKFARYDVEWLDTKFNKDEITHIATVIPFPSKTVPEKKIRNMYKEFFRSLQEVLSGKAVFITKKLEILKELCTLEFVEEREVRMGKSLYWVVVYKN